MYYWGEKVANEEEIKTTTRKPVEIKPDPDLEGHIEKMEAGLQTDSTKGKQQKGV